MKQKIDKLFSMVTVFGICIVLSVTNVFATTLTGLNGRVSIADTKNTLKTSGTGWTATAKGSLFGTASNTITITNNLSEQAQLIVSYSVASASSFTIDEASAATSGTFTKALEPNGTAVFKITSKSGISGTTVTLTISEITLTVMQAESDVTFSYDTSLGSVTAGGGNVADGEVKQIASSGATLVAAPKGGATFLGWVDESNSKILSRDTTYTYQPADDATVIAAFASASTDAWFVVDNQYLTDDLNEAGTLGTKIVLASNGTLPAGTYTIPAGVTLLIPYNDANTLCTADPTQEENSYTAPSVFRTLTMADGANITVNGALSVSGAQSTKYGHNGMPSGPLGFIKMNSGSKITVNSGATLYAWGYIQGSGSVEIKSGGTVYECFQIADFRGGDATTQIIGKADDYGVFPFTQYYIQNVEVPMTLHAGAIENGHSSAQVTLAGAQRMKVPFIGTSNAMLIVTSGHIVKDYMEGTGRTNIEIHGDMKISPVTIEMKISLVGTAKIESSKYALPIPHHLTLKIESGTVTLNQNMAFLPGSELYIKDGATCALGSGNKAYFYDLDQWLYNNGANGYSGTTNLPYMKLKYVPGVDGTTGRSKDALAQVDGTVDASAGEVYVTAGGANIFSTGTGVVKVKPVSGNKTYQVTTNDTQVSGWPEIPITAVRLINSNNTYTETAKAADTLTYTYTDGFWQHNGVAQWDYTTTDSSMNKSVSHSKIYATLANAVTAYGGTGYIQMLTESTAATTIDKAVLIDLNGKPVSGVTVTTTGIQFMDTTANGYETPQGKLTVVSGIDKINLVSTYENGTTKKHYVKVANKDTDGKLDGTHSFHRAGVSLTGIQYTIGTDYVLFQGIFRGNETVAGALKRVGFQFSDSGSTWRVVEEKEKVGTMHPFTYARALPEAAISAEALLDFGAEPYAESLLRTSITLPST